MVLHIHWGFPSTKMQGLCIELVQTGRIVLSINGDRVECRDGVAKWNGYHIQVAQKSTKLVVVEILEAIGARLRNRLMSRQRSRLDIQFSLN